MVGFVSKFSIRFCGLVCRVMAPLVIRISVFLDLILEIGLSLL